MSGASPDDVANMDDTRAEMAMATESLGSGDRMLKSPTCRTRSLSDGGGTPSKLSPSPYIAQATRRQSKDDSSIRDSSTTTTVTSSIPSTPVRAGFPSHGLSIQMPPRDPRLAPEANVSPTRPTPDVRPAPLSPKLDHSHIYASPNILPRRSRGLDFSRAATSLHHSTIADQGTPDSSPTIGSRAMNIPGRRSNDYGNAEHSSNSLWTVMGHHHERSTVSSSLGSTLHMGSEPSSSSDDDDFMDEDMDETFVTTPQVAKTSTMTPASLHPISGAPWMPVGSPAINSLMSFQQRQRPRRQSRKKLRGPLGLGFQALNLPQASLSKSPPNNVIAKDMASADAHPRRESISWAANQLHISGSESDDPKSRMEEGVDSPSRPSVIKRAVTRRGNLLPKTKGFARIRAALAEESAPVEAEVAREAEVVRQVRESDMDIEPRLQRMDSGATTALSSPNLDNMDYIPDDAMMVDPGAAGLGLSSSFKQQVLRNSKGKDFWDTFSETSGSGRRGSNPSRMTPPPPLFGLPRGSSAGLSLPESDVNMDSPSSNGTSTTNGNNNNNMFPIPRHSTASSSGADTPSSSQAQPSSLPTTAGYGPAPNNSISGPLPPTAAEITRRINNKRRRDDDFDPASFKRRAVSPGMSVHNSPILQSPMQRDVGSWGSRPGSVGGDGISKSDSGNQTGRTGKALGRVGFQGMIDTNDGITKLSIE